MLKSNIIAVKSDIISGGYFVNDKQVETKTERFIYNNKKILTKVYHNNRLCMIQVAKA